MILLASGRQAAGSADMWFGGYGGGSEGAVDKIFDIPSPEHTLSQFLSRSEGAVDKFFVFPSSGHTLS